MCFILALQSLTCVLFEPLEWDLLCDIEGSGRKYEPRSGKLN